MFLSNVSSLSLAYIIYSNRLISIYLSRKVRAFQARWQRHISKFSYVFNLIAISLSLSTIIACSNDKTKELPPVQNSYLENASDQTPVAASVLRAAKFYINGTISADSGTARPITKFEYGSLTDLGASYDISAFPETSFKAALDSEKLDNSKNNIIKLTTSKINEVAVDTYYYSHINGKPFTQFLPAVNRLEILALESKFNENIFNSADSAEVYNKLKSFVTMAQGYTFKGLALLSFSSLNVINVIRLDNYQYTGKFELTFNNDLPEIVNAATEYYSMKITLDQESTAAPIADQASASTTNPIVKTIEVKNFKFADFSTIKSYSSEDTAVNWFSNLYSARTNTLAFSQKDSKINQIAGNLTIAAQNPNTQLQDLKYTRIVFASNESCEIGSDGCKAVELTGE